MPTLLRAATHLVTADHRMFGVADSSEGSTLDTPIPGLGEWFASTERQIVIAVAEDMIQPRLLLELWDARPPAWAGPPEAEGLSSLNVSSGTIGINQITAGWSANALSVPPARYRARLAAYGRQDVAARYQELAARFSDWEDPQFAQEREALTGREDYIIQLW